MIQNTFFYKSDIGWLKIEASNQGLVGVEYVEEVSPNSQLFLKDRLIKEITTQLDEYFAGKRKVFDLPLDLESSSTDFQKKVWSELIKIPYGETISYAELAKRVGNPKASRAVGNANGKNCIPIIIPCHRVVKSDGTLGGYSSGVERKKWLLEFERKR